MYSKLLLLSLVSKTLTNDIESPDTRKVQHVAKMMFTLDSSQSQDDWQKFIRNYGCYCYVHDGNRKIGQRNDLISHPVVPLDAMDEACRAVARAQRCIDIDENNGRFPENKCHLGSTYKWYHDTNTNTIICNDENDPTWAAENTCRTTLCAYEKRLVETVVSLYQDASFNKNMAWHRMDDVTYKATCLKTDSGNSVDNGNRGSQDYDCCGTGVDRRTFNIAVHDCCNGGLGPVMDAGSC